MGSVAFFHLYLQVNFCTGGAGRITERNAHVYWPNWTEYSKRDYTLSYVHTLYVDHGRRWTVFGTLISRFCQKFSQVSSMLLVNRHIHKAPHLLIISAWIRLHQKWLYTVRSRNWTELKLMCLPLCWTMYGQEVLGGNSLPNMGQFFLDLSRRFECKNNVLTNSAVFEVTMRQTKMIVTLWSE